MGMSPDETAQVICARPPSCRFFGNLKDSITGGPEVGFITERMLEDIVISLFLTVNIQLYFTACFLPRSAAHNTSVSSLVPTGLHVVDDELPALMYFTE